MTPAPSVDSEKQLESDSISRKYMCPFMLLANGPSIFQVKHDTGKIRYQWEREKCEKISNG